MARNGANHRPSSEARQIGELLALKQAAIQSWTPGQLEQTRRRIDAAARVVDAIPPGFAKGSAALEGAALRLTPDWDPTLASALLWCLEHDRPANVAAALEVWNAQAAPSGLFGDTYPFDAGEPPNPFDYFAAGSDGFELLLALGEDALANAGLPYYEESLVQSATGESEWGNAFALWTTLRSPALAAQTQVQLAALGDAQVRRAQAELVPRSWQGEDLVGAAAMRAFAFRRLGIGTDLQGGFVDRLRLGQIADGVWPEPAGHIGDLLTTVATAEFLCRSTDWDPAPAVEWVLGQQSSDGLWWDHGHLGTWMTRLVLQFLESSCSSPAERFLWPIAIGGTRDVKTEIGNIGHFEAVSRAFESGSPDAPVGVAFLDLVGFGEFNNQYGQVEGDACLRAFAGTIRGLPGTEPARDGGDEFLLVTPPGGMDALDDLGMVLSARWAAAFSDAFPAARRRPDARGVWTVARACEIRQTRAELGREMGSLKEAQKQNCASEPAELIRRV